MTKDNNTNDIPSAFRFPIIKLGAYSAIDWIVAFSVSLAILWKPLSMWILKIDAAGRIPFLLLAVSFILYMRRIWRTSLRHPLTIYCFVAIYMFLNGCIQHGYLTYPSNGMYLMFCSALQAPAIMLMIAAAAKKDFDTTLDWLVIALFAYVILALLCSGFTYSDRDDLDINANEIALYTAILFTLLLLKFFRNRLTFFPLIISEIIPLFTIIKTGSRMALTMVAIVTVAAILLSQDRRNMKSIVLSFVFITMFTVGMVFIMNHTHIGERMRGTTTQVENSRSVGTSTILDKFGDRGLQYFYSWPYFIEKPLFGIGFKNWILYNPFKLVCHSEYMVQYVENGLVAFIPYMIFFLALMRRSWAGRKHKDRRSRSCSLFLLASMLAIAFGNSVLWSHDMFCVFATYALCYAQDTPERKKHRRIRIVLKSRPEKDNL